MKEFKVFEAIAAEPSKNGKMAILKTNDSDRLRRVLWLTYNKFLTYRIKDIQPPAAYNDLQPNVYGELNQLCELLAEHQTGTTAAKNLIKNLMSKCTESNALWVQRIITRDLNIGIDEGTINKVFPGLIPVFDCQLAFPIYSERKGKDKQGNEIVIIKNYWPTLKYPVVVEEKLDGMRVIAICKNGEVKFYSREGHELEDYGVFAEQILKLMPGADFVLDGEAIAHTFNPDHKVALKYKDDNWPFESGKSMMKSGTKEEKAQYLGFYVWDVLDVEFFESQGKIGKAKPLKERKAELLALFERQGLEFKNLFMVPNVVCHSEADVKEMFDIVRSKGGVVCSAVDKNGKTITYTLPRGEGCMVKAIDATYEFKRSDAILKVKSFSSMDLRVDGAYEGEKDSRNEGTLGGLNCSSDCGRIKTDIGGGFSESMRDYFWMRHLEGTLNGIIIEVSYMDITVDGKLRHGNFLRIRDDRTTTSVEG